MIKKTRSWIEGETQFVHLRFIERDFYGPWVDLLLEKKEEMIPVVEVNSESYNFEDASVAEGLNKTVEKAAKEIFEMYGKYKLISKFGVIEIKSEDTEKAFDDFQKRIILF